MTPEDSVSTHVYDNRIVLRFLSYIQPHRKQALIALASLLFNAVLGATSPLVIKYGIDWAIAGSGTSRIHLIGAIFLTIAVLHFLTNRLQRRLMLSMSQRILYDLRSDTFRHLLNQSNAFYHHTPVGRIMSRIQADVTRLQGTFGMLSGALAQMFTVVAVVALMLWIDWQLALVCMTVIPALVGVMLYWQRSARRSSMRVRLAGAAVHEEYSQSIAGVRVIQSLNRQNENLTHFRDLNREHLDSNMVAVRQSGALLPLTELLIGSAIGLGVVLFGGYLLQRGALEIGTLAAFALWIQRFFEPVRQLTTQYGSLQRTMASGARVFEILDMEPDVKDSLEAVDMPGVIGEVEYRDVDFHYTPGVPVLRGVNLRIAAGENVALVGVTGAGKSTLVSLLYRSADVTGGSITVDGYDVRDVKRESLVRQIGVVLQEPYLFSGTVMENLRYRDAGATVEEVVAAAKTAGAHDFIMELKGGYDSELGERGVNLSVGQRQLISLARAIVGNPRILALDEATANIDTRTEAVIQEALGRALKGRTSIVIAHRLSTVRNADRIVVLDEGQGCGGGDA